jgi:hypothetical protein
MGPVSTPSHAPRPGGAPDARPTSTAGAPAAPAPARLVDDAPLIPGRSADDSDAGWGEDRPDSNDDRLLRDVPPHW